MPSLMKFTIARKTDYVINKQSLDMIRAGIQQTPILTAALTSQPPDETAGRVDSTALSIWNILGISEKEGEFYSKTIRNITPK